MSAAVPRLWPGSTIVCLGTGPSLTQADVDSCRGRARVIAIKHAIDMAPWADVLYACGADASRWWQKHGERLAGFAGLRYTLDPKGEPHATVLKNTGYSGIETDPSGLRTGKNSGFQAINLAAHLGAVRIVLLGYDMMTGANDRDHFYGSHANGVRVPFHDLKPFFVEIVAPLRALGVEVVNATRSSALDCFPKVSLADALAEAAVA